jgi:hypothetical protein
LASVFIQCERSFLKYNTTYRSRKAVNDVAQDETERLQGWSHPEAPCCKASHKHDRDPGPKVGITQHMQNGREVARTGGRVQGIYTRLANYTICKPNDTRATKSSKKTLTPVSW